MKTFVDTAKRTWTVKVDIAAFKRVKALLGINLEDVLSGDLMIRLTEDPVLLCDILYVVCKPEADSLKITDEQFGQAMAGDAIELATDALMQEIVDFFPSRKRRILQDMAGKLNLLRTTLENRAQTRLDSLDVNAVIEAAEKQSGSSSSSLPASSGSTPSVSIPAPSAS